LQDRFMLGDFYVFESSDNHYHAVSLSKVMLSTYLEILKNSSVDTNYISVPLYFGKKIWTLRLSDKFDTPIRFIGKFKTSAYTHYYQSTAHSKVLNTLFNLGIKLDNPDNIKELILARYPI